MTLRNYLVALAGAVAVTGAAAADDAANGSAIFQTVGVSASSYKYVEDDVMSLKGNKLGLDYNLKYALERGWFVAGDARYARGKVDYESNGTGSMEGNTNWYAEWRLTSGYDFTFGSQSLGPYMGLGFRYLFHDGRGETSTGHLGYRRESRYVYLPLGVAHRISFGNRMKLTTTIEYNYLLQGRQTSELGDVFIGTASPLGTTFVSCEAAKNDQKHGHGWRGSIMLQAGSWSLGPYASYWRIADSETDDILLTDDAGNRWISTGWYEPKNKTTEAGFKVFYSF
jgi:hypothetical protein